MRLWGDKEYVNRDYRITRKRKKKTGVKPKEAGAKNKESIEKTDKSTF